MSFWDSSFLWLEAVIAASAVGAACAVVGVYTILRRVVFLPAALSQVSGFGVVLAFLLPAWFVSLEGSFLSHPLIVAAVVTLAASLLFGWMPEPRRLSRDAVIGVAFILASALILIIGDRIPEGGHDIKDILYGNAVAVESSQMVVALVVSVGVIAVHAVLMRPFLFASFDPDTASAHRVPVRAIDAVLFLSIGLTIAVATKTIGALPVFAFGVLPGVAALSAFHDMRRVLVVAAVIGAASAFLGYWLSFVASVPTGPCMAAVTALFIVPAMIVGRLRKAA